MLNSMEKDLSATEGGLSNEHGLAVDVDRVLTYRTPSDTPILKSLFLEKL